MKYYLKKKKNLDEMRVGKKKIWEKDKRDKEKGIQNKYKRIREGKSNIRNEKNSIYV